MTWMGGMVTRVAGAVDLWVGHDTHRGAGMVARGMAGDMWHVTCRGSRGKLHFFCENLQFFEIF